MVRQPHNNNTFFSIIAIVILLSSVPSVAATSYLSSGLALSGFFNHSEIAGDSFAVSYSPDEELIAAGYGSGVVIYNSTSKEVIKSIYLNDAVNRVEFSADGQFLVLGLRSLESHQNSIVLLSKESEWNVIDDAAGSKRVMSVSISPNNTKIAFNGPTTNILEVNMSNFEDSVTFDGIHSSTVTCLSYSTDGSFLLSGGSDGRLVRWNRSNGTAQVIHNFEAVGISDCSYSPDNGRFAVLSGGGIINIYSEFTELEFSDDITLGTRLKWSDDGLKIYAIRTIGSSKLLSYISASGTWTGGTITNIGHEISDFDIKSDYSTLITATNTGHLAEYSNSFSPQFFGISGLDSDGDGIPNDYDEDDDGDGIIDKWDSECPGGISCSLTPKQNSIRQLKILVSNGEVMAFDIVLLTSEQSSAIRNLTTKSIVDDIFLTEQEAYRMSDSICSNIIQQDLIDSWGAKLSIEGVSLSNGEVGCSATHGLLDSTLGDYETRIRITTFTTFTMSGNPTIPYNISVSGMIPMPSGSAAQIAPLFPILVKVDAVGSDEFEVLWDSVGSGIILPVNEATPAELTLFDKISVFIIDYFLWAIVAAILTSLGIISAIRRRNLKALNINLDVDEDLTEDETTLGQEEAMWRADEGAAPPKPSTGPPPSRRQRVSSSLSPSLTAKKSQKVRRRAGAEQFPEDSKRTRLDSHSKEDIPPDEWDYGWDAAYEDTSEAFDYAEEISVPQVRKVKTEVVESQPKKRRKAKRRSAKTKGKSKESLAEKKSTTTDDVDENEMMDSALDKLVFNEERD